MSHFKVLVFGDNVDEQLAPFHEYECTGVRDQYVKEIDITEECKNLFEKNKGDAKSLAEFAYSWYGYKLFSEQTHTLDSDEVKFGYVKILPDGSVKVVRVTNPNSKWDWYVIGGRYSNRLLIKNGNYTDSCLKRNLDLLSMKEKARLDATREYDEYENIVQGTPAFLSWQTIRSSIPEIDKAREAYWSQPRIKKIQESNSDLIYSIEELNVPREEYIQKAVDATPSAFAYVKDSNWFARGDMGWFATVSNEKDSKEWTTSLSDAIEGLSDETLITVVDCHI
jgi:hypothetical protein